MPKFCFLSFIKNIYIINFNLNLFKGNVKTKASKNNDTNPKRIM